MHAYIGTDAPTADLFGCVRPRKPIPPGATPDVGGPGQFQGLFLQEADRHRAAAGASISNA
jgi:hypothetical protein